MKTIKTIQQYSTIYNISQFGNRSFRITFASEGEKRVHHLDRVFDTLNDAEEYIRACSNMDRLNTMTAK